MYLLEMVIALSAFSVVTSIALPGHTLDKVMALFDFARTDSGKAGLYPAVYQPFSVKVKGPSHHARCVHRQHLPKVT